MYRGNDVCSEGMENRIFTQHILDVLKERMYADYIACQEGEYNGFEEGRFPWAKVKSEESN